MKQFPGSTIRGTAIKSNYEDSSSRFVFSQSSRFTRTETAQDQQQYKQQRSSPAAANSSPGWLLSNRKRKSVSSEHKRAGRWQNQRHESNGKDYVVRRLITDIRESFERAELSTN